MENEQKLFSVFGSHRKNGHGNPWPAIRWRAGPRGRPQARATPAGDVHKKSCQANFFQKSWLGNFFILNQKLIQPVLFLLSNLIIRKKVAKPTFLKKVGLATFFVPVAGWHGAGLRLPVGACACAPSHFWPGAAMPVLLGGAGMATFSWRCARDPQDGGPKASTAARLWPWQKISPK